MTTGKYVAILAPMANGKNYAAKFAAKDLQSVQKAADANKIFVLDPQTLEVAKLVAKLPAGKLNGNDVPTIPIFKGPWPEPFNKLAPIPSEPMAEPSVKVTLWDDLNVGAICVAKESAEDGWWPCRVAGISADGSKLTLKWVDAPGQAPVVRGRDQVALLHPKFL